MQIEIIEFPLISDPRGNLTFIENSNQIPFKINRVFWTYDLPSSSSRGGHSLQKSIEVIIAISGSFTVEYKNEVGELNTIILNKPNQGLLIQPKTWRKLKNFSSNSISLHLASEKFDPKEYNREND